ncbi:MAG: DUF922 domain-containing protein [Candidatus Dadabacteria bacterium]|nr:MAG: DUF922 domain-containing protein [Candidatus Dadabacteria bacterium]
MKFIWHTFICFLLIPCVALASDDSDKTLEAVERILKVANVKIVYYDVKGKSSKELREEILKKGPRDKYEDKGRFAYTSWDVKWHWPKKEDGSPDFLKTTSDYKITVIFPRWVNSENAPEELKKRWHDFAVALAMHEKGHIDLFLDHVDEIAESIKATAKNNPEMKARHANRIAHNILRVMQNRDREYDIVTDNGALEGVFLP